MFQTIHTHEIQMAHLSSLSSLSSKRYSQISKDDREPESVIGLGPNRKKVRSSISCIVKSAIGIIIDAFLCHSVGTRTIPFHWLTRWFSIIAFVLLAFLVHWVLCQQTVKSFLPVTYTIFYSLLELSIYSRIKSLFGTVTSSGFWNLIWNDVWPLFLPLLNKHMN